MLVIEGGGNRKKSRKRRHRSLGIASYCRRESVNMKGFIIHGEERGSRSEGILGH